MGLSTAKSGAVMSAAVDARTCPTAARCPGGLDVERKAQNALPVKSTSMKARRRAENRIVCAYAYAVSEQNATGGVIVTAPTCGACGVLPSVLVLYAGTAAAIAGCARFSTRSRRGGADRQSDQDERLHQRRGVRLSGGDRQRLRHGGGGPGRSCSSMEHRPDRIRRRGRAWSTTSASPATPFAASCRFRASSATPWPPCAPSTRVRIANFLTATRKISFDTVVKHHVRDRQRFVLQIQRNRRRRACEVLYG